MSDEPTSTAGRLMEALRLTRAGRLDEATALLRGAAPGGASGAAPGAAPLPEGTPSAAGAGWQGSTWSGAAGRSVLDQPSPRPTSPGTFTSHVARCAQGERRFKLYRPSSQRGTALPLVVMLHGCTQSADDFAAGTAMNAVAEEEGLLVAYPEQDRAANAQRCWNWFRPGDQGRGGEPAIMAAMVAMIAELAPLDRARVFAAGLSAGGAAAAVLGQAYPEVFAAVGVHSGLACGAAHDLASAMRAMQGAPESAAAAPGRRVPTIVFHGSADRTVDPANARAVLRQAIAGLPAPTIERGRSPGGIAYERAVYRQDDRGSDHGDGARIAAEAWALDGLGHAWSGGSHAGSYTDPRGPDASRAMVRFFLGR